jgi:LmeA-like phospholipid-binding
MRKILLFLLLIVVAALVIGDLALKSFAEERMADALEAALDIPADADVGVDAFPFVLRTLQGRYPAVSVEAEEVGNSSVRFTRLRIEFEDVEFSLGELISGDDRSVRLGSGDGEALLSERDLNRALRRNAAPGRVDLQTDGDVEVTSAEGSLSGSARVTIEGSNLVVSPEGDLPSFSLELPRFGENMSYESLDIRGSTARLGLSVGPTVAEF